MNMPAAAHVEVAASTGSRLSCKAQNIHLHRYSRH
jgi:hypothetical protein